MGMRYKGWESGYEDAFVYDLGEYRLVLKFSPGYNHYNVDSKALMSFRSLQCTVTINPSLLPNLMCLI